MLHWALFLFVGSLVASYFEQPGLAKGLEGISIYLVVVFAGLFCFSFILDRLYRASRRG